MALTAQHNQAGSVSILWWSIIGIAAAVIAVSLFEFVSFGFSNVGILIVAVVVAVLLAPYRLRIPRTESLFYPKTVFAFWGIAWLGMYGGVLLALASSWADRGNFRSNPWNWVKGVSRDVLCAFASASIFHLALSYFSSPSTTVVAGSFFVPNEVVFASCAMAVAYFAVGAGIDLLNAKMQGDRIDTKLFDRIVTNPSTGHFASLGVAICLFLVFNHFGIEFGFVLLPMAIAANVAYKIHTRSLEQKTKEIMEASRIHLATVEALATAIDARDQVGVGHVRRTQIYAVGIGKLLNLSDGEIDALRTGALLHDIGKLAVPDHILNKPGRLTQAEMEKTKIHSSVGASILEKVGFTSPVVPTVKYHHEFWDGSGYPEGLRGNQIPLTARILSVADAFDTLRDARPYRPAISRDDACNFLRAGSAAQFDPKIVDLLVRNLRELEDEIEAQGLTYETENDDLKLEGTGSSFVEQIKRANREVFTLYSLAREFGAALTLDQTLSLFTDKIREFVPYDGCAVYLLDDTGEFATVVHTDGPSGSFLSGRRVRVGEGATGYALKKHKSVENVDPALDFTFTPDEAAFDFKTMVSRPLVADEKVIGAISLYSAELSQYQDEHLRLLETVSRIAADAIAKTKQHAETASHAMTDPITGLPNARCLQAAFEKEVKRSLRNDSSFQVLMLDLDGFKAVNDSYGHKVGDRMLTALGVVIREQLREYDFLARYAGDEFVALIPETDGDSVQELCRRIEDAVSAFGISVSETEAARVGVSIGTASYPGQGESFDQLIISADKAMYAAKALHKQNRNHLDDLVKVKKTAEPYVPEEKPVAAHEFIPRLLDDRDDQGDPLVVELDERHVISTASVN